MLNHCLDWVKIPIYTPQNSSRKQYLAYHQCPKKLCSGFKRRENQPQKMFCTQWAWSLSLCGESSFFILHSITLVPPSLDTKVLFPPAHRPAANTLLPSSDERTIHCAYWLQIYELRVALPWLGMHVSRWLLIMHVLKYWQHPNILDFKHVITDTLLYILFFYFFL